MTYTLLPPAENKNNPKERWREMSYTLPPPEEYILLLEREGVQ